MSAVDLRARITSQTSLLKPSAHPHALIHDLDTAQCLKVIIVLGKFFLGSPDTLVTLLALALQVLSSVV